MGGEACAGFWAMTSRLRTFLPSSDAVLGKATKPTAFVQAVFSATRNREESEMDRTRSGRCFRMPRSWFAQAPG